VLSSGGDKPRRSIPVRSQTLFREQIRRVKIETEFEKRDDHDGSLKTSSKSPTAEEWRMGNVEDDWRLTDDQRAHAVFQTAQVLKATAIKWNSDEPARVWLRGHWRELVMTPLSVDRMAALFRSFMGDRRWSLVETQRAIEFLHFPFATTSGVSVRVQAEGGQVCVDAQVLHWLDSAAEKGTD
jgi:hypothetical protein